MIGIFLLLFTVCVSVLDSSLSGTLFLCGGKMATSCSRITFYYLTWNSRKSPKIILICPTSVTHPSWNPSIWLVERTMLIGQGWVMCFILFHTPPFFSSQGWARFTQTHGVREAEQWVPQRTISFQWWEEGVEGTGVCIDKRCPQACNLHVYTKLLSLAFPCIAPGTCFGTLGK